MKTPLKLLKISLKNFMSYGNDYTTVNLDFNKPILIIGKNYDDMVNGQIDSNGSGKTTILNAITWSLFDKTISKMDKNDLINNDNKKNMEVCIEFKKNQKYYRIQRFRKNKALGGDGAIILESDNKDFKNAKDIAVDRISLINKQIEDIIDIPYDVFTKIFVFTPATEDFFSLPTTSTKDKNNQRDILEEIFGYTEISKKAKALKITLDDNKKDLKRLEELNDTILAQQDKIDNQIKNTILKRDEWEKNKKNNIENITNEIKTLKKVNFDKQFLLYSELNDNDNKIIELQNDIKLLKKDVSIHEETSKKAFKWDMQRDDDLFELDLKIQKISDIDFKIEEKKLKDKEELGKKKKELESELTPTKQIESAIKEKNKKEGMLETLLASKCPYCNQEYHDNKEKIEIIKKEISELNNKIINDEKTNKLVNKKIDGCQDKLFKIEPLFDSYRDLDKNKNELDSLKTKYKELQEKDSPYNEISSEEVINYIKECKDNITKKENVINELNNKNISIKKKLLFENENECRIASTKQEILESNLDKVNNEENPYIDAIKDLEKLQVKDTKAKEIKELKDSINHMDFLYKLLTKKDSFIRKALLNKKIPFLNKKLNEYLSQLGLPHKVYFTEEMTASIRKFNKVFPYHNLSTGQKARLNLALSLAFKDVLESRYGKISFCIMDECLDTGLGSVGVQLAAKMLKNISNQQKISMFIISHRDEISNQFDDILMIELRNKFSSVTEMFKK